MPTRRSRAGGEIALPSAPLHVRQPRTWPFGPRPAHLAFAPSARFAWPAALAAGRGHNQPLLWTGPHAANVSGTLTPVGACVTRHRASVVMPTPAVRACGEFDLPSAPLHVRQPRTWPFVPRPAHLVFAPVTRLAWPAALAAGRGHNQPLLWSGPHAANGSGTLTPVGACVTRHRASVVIWRRSRPASTRLPNPRR